LRIGCKRQAAPVTIERNAHNNIQGTPVSYGTIFPGRLSAIGWQVAFSAARQRQTCDNESAGVPGAHQIL